MSGGEASGSWPPRGISRLSSRAHLSQRVEAGQRQVTGDRLSTLMSCICLADPGRGPVRKQKETGKAGSVREDDAQGCPGAWTRGPATRALPWSASASSNGTSKKKPLLVFVYASISVLSAHTQHLVFVDASLFFFIIFFIISVTSNQFLHRRCIRDGELSRRSASPSRTSPCLCDQPRNERWTHYSTAQPVVPLCKDCLCC